MLPTALGPASAKHCFALLCSVVCLVVAFVELAGLARLAGHPAPELMTVTHSRPDPSPLPLPLLLRLTLELPPDKVGVLVLPHRPTLLYSTAHFALIKHLIRTSTSIHLQNPSTVHYLPSGPWGREIGSGANYCQAATRH